MGLTEREELYERVREVDALFRVADAIGRATSLDELLDESIETLLEATGADRAAVLLYEDDVLRFRAWRRLSDEYRAEAERHSPWPVDAIDHQPVLVADISQAGFDDIIEAAVRDEGIGALALIPLVHGDRLVGRLVLYHDSPYEWSEREVRLAGTIANHLASATIRTAVRAALLESRELLETIMSTVDEGVIVQSVEGSVVYANEAAARVVGFESAAAFIAADRQEVLERFEILDEDGNPLPADELPGRRALRGESSERVVRYRVRATGAERWSNVRANPVRGVDGSVELAISVIHDITRARARAESGRFLARASQLLNESLEIESTLGALADVAVPAFAGHVTVDLYDDGVLRCVGARHVDPQKTEMMIRLRKKYPPTVPEHPVQRAIRSGEAQLVPDVQAEAETMAHDEEHARAYPRAREHVGHRRTVDGKRTHIRRDHVRHRAAAAAVHGSGSRARRRARPPRVRSSRQRPPPSRGRRTGARCRSARVRQRRRLPRRQRRHRAALEPGGREGIPGEDPQGARPAGGGGDLRLGDPPRADRGRAGTHRGSEPRRDPAGRRQGDRAVGLDLRRPLPGGTVYAFRDLTEERAVDQLKSDFVSTVSHELRTPLAAIYGAALTLQRDDVRLEESQRAGCST